ncbi:hypothetical protein Tco_0199897 [Tanacetum coccineum]
MYCSSDHVFDNKGIQMLNFEALRTREKLEPVRMEPYASMEELRYLVMTFYGRAHGMSPQIESYFYPFRFREKVSSRKDAILVPNMKADIASHVRKCLTVAYGQG